MAHAGGTMLGVQALKALGLPVADPEAGVHAHGLDRARGRTLVDGPHLHIFMLPDGSTLATREDGAHDHEIGDAGRFIRFDGQHKHLVVVADGTEIWTEIGGDHEHDLLVEVTAFDGTHEHALTLPDGTTIKSMSAADFARATGRGSPGPSPGPASEIIGKQETKTEGGMQFPARAFAFVPDGTKPSTWKLRLYDRPADVPDKPSIRLTAAAAQALSPSGFRGQRVQLPSGALSGVKGKVRAAWSKARRQAGQEVSAEDVPTSLKRSSTEEKRTHKKPKRSYAKAISLSLDPAGQAAFERISAGSLALAETILGLGKAVEIVAKQFLITSIPEVVLAPVGYSVVELVKDLCTIATQTKDCQIRNQTIMFATLLDKAEFATGDLATGGGAKQPGQGFKTPFKSVKRGDLYSVVDADGRVVQADMTQAAAEARAVVLNKSDNELKTLKLQIVKREGEEEERTVFGIVLEPETIDSQNDIYDEETIRKTAFRFMESYQQFGLMHKQIIPTILPLESFLAPVDFEIEGQKIKKGTWLLRVRVLDDQIWTGVKSGDLGGFSIGGTAIRKPEIAGVAA